MHYIVVTEIQDNSNTTSCKIQGLPEVQTSLLVQELSTTNVYYVRQDSDMDIDWPGVEILNRLSNSKYGYKVVGQSMTTDKTVIGSRPIQVQKIVWTLYKL